MNLLCLPILRWVAYYEDGTVIHEGDNNIRSPLRINRQGLTRFALITREGATKAEITLHAGQTLFYRTIGTMLVGGFTWYRYMIGYRTKEAVYFQAVDEYHNVSEHTQFNGRWSEPKWYPEETPTPAQNTS